MNIEIEYLLRAKEEGLSTDDYIIFLLAYQKDYEALSKIPIDHRLLVGRQQQGWIKLLGDDFEDIVVREKFLNFVPPINTNTANNVKEWFEDWFNLFPEGQKAGSGMYLRFDSKDAFDKMIKFVKKYKYDKETIIAATENYLRKQKLDGYRFCSTANYFIYKQGRGSLLAAECDNYDKMVKPNSMRNVI